MMEKGRLSFKQYIPSKCHWSDGKIFVFSDVEGNYIMKSETEHDEQLGAKLQTLHCLYMPFI